MNYSTNDNIESIEVARLLPAAFDHLKHGVIIYDANLAILEINQRVRDLLEISEEDARIGDSFEKVVRLNAERGGYGASGNIEDRVAWRMKRARAFDPFHEDQQLFNGRYCEVYGQPVPGGGYVLTYTDITDRVEAEEAKSQFLAKMSHDIRTPLHGIVGMSELLETSELNADQKAMVDTIMRSSRVLLHFINDILDLSKIESGKLELNSEAYVLTDVLEDVVSTLQAIASKKKVFLRLEIDPGVPRYIYGDPARLAQCVVNLAGNAIKFSTAPETTNPKPVDIKVSLSSPDCFRIRVRDEGIGINAAQQESLFIPFVQGNRTGLNEADGFGLGLSIVAELVKLMRGEISLDSIPGEGSSFTLTLPLVPIDKDEVTTATQIDSANVEASTGNWRILLMEDNRDIQEVLRRQLTVLGCQVDVADDGESGLQYWRKGHYDLILSDWNMPLLNGLEMVKILRSEESARGSKPIPVVGITGNAIPGEAEQCLDAGMNDFLTKPLTIADLKEKLSQYLT